MADLVAEGFSNKDIASRLRLSLGTVKQYLHRAFRKLGITNRTEMAVWVHSGKCS